MKVYYHKKVKYQIAFLRQECAGQFGGGFIRRAGLAKWIACDNADRLHAALGGTTPDHA